MPVRICTNWRKMPRTICTKRRASLPSGKRPSMKSMKRSGIVNCSTTWYVGCYDCLLCQLFLAFLSVVKEKGACYCESQSVVVNRRAGSVHHMPAFFLSFHFPIASNWISYGQNRHHQYYFTVQHAKPVTQNNLSSNSNLRVTDLTYHVCFSRPI